MRLQLQVGAVELSTVPLQQAGVQGRGAADLADGAGIILAGLHIALQQLDHDGLGEVAGGASFPRGWGVVEGLHVFLAKAQDRCGWNPHVQQNNAVTLPLSLRPQSGCDPSGSH